MDTTVTNIPQNAKRKIVHGRADHGKVKRMLRKGWRIEQIVNDNSPFKTAFYHLWKSP